MRSSPAWQARRPGHRTVQDDSEAIDHRGGQGALLGCVILLKGIIPHVEEQACGGSGWKLAWLEGNMN